MRKVAVLGGGPAGAFSAERLASAGLDVVLIDEKLAWEKPCGGGLTYKAYSQYPFLIENDTPKKLVSHSCLSSERTGDVTMALTRPFIIYSRLQLNQMLLDRAEQAGAQLEKTRVLGVERRGHGWSITTRTGDIHADYCIMAMGARNTIRDLGTAWSANDTMVALGYYVPTEQAHIDIQFFPNFEGYIWVFPRNGHLSVGICGKGESSQAMRARLERFMLTRDLSTRDAKFYGHVLPALEKSAWRSNRIAGERWMAVGDAGGFVDPITGEGLYYAIRSADLAARIIVEDRHAPAQQPAAYRHLLQHDFIEDLELASRLSKRFFLGRFLYDDVPSRIIQFMRRSPTFCDLMQDLFAGTQNYLDLKARLKASLRGTIQEVLMSLFLRNLVPDPNRA